MDLKKVQGRVTDLLVIAGAAVFVYGLGLAWKPLWFIVGGLVLAGGAFLVGYKQPRGMR